jgi:MFS family permease
MVHTTGPRNRLNFIIKVVIGLIFVTVIGYQLLHEKDLGAMWSSFLDRWSVEHAWMVVLAISLMPVCWLLEAKKWKLLMRPALGMTLGNALKAVLGGVALSLFTPNRIGEYGGRILFVPARYNWRAVIATLIGSFAQNLVSIAFGFVGGVAFLVFSTIIPHSLRTGLGILTALILGFGVLIYFRIPAISLWAEKLKPPSWLRRPWRALKYLQQITQRDLLIAIGFSFTKYLVFTTQFVLLLIYFGVDVPVFWIFGGVAVMYLMQTGVPLPPFVDVVARSELAVLLWASFAVNELSVLAASFFLWVINLLIPAFFGLIAISTVNVLRSLGYESQIDNISHVSSSNNTVAGTAVGSSE